MAGWGFTVLLLSVVSIVLAQSPPEGAPPPSPGAPSAPEPTKPSSPGPGSFGFVVRLETTETLATPVVATLAPLSGELVEIQLRDDGKDADVTQGDGVWSGTVWAAGSEFDVSLASGSGNHSAGRVSWPEDQQQRDLMLKLKEGTLTATATAAPAGGQGGTTIPSTQPVDAGGGVGGLANTSSDQTWNLVLAIGAIALGGVAYLWMRGGGKRRGAAELPRGVSLVAEAGLFGAGSPGLAGGLSVIDAGDAAAEALPGLLAAMARYRAVVVQAPERSEVPAVRGGPVYRVADSAPGAVGEAADFAGEAGAPVAVLVLADSLDDAALKALSEALPAGVGGLVLARNGTLSTFPTYALRESSSGYELSSPSGVVRLVPGVDGLVRGG